MEYKGKLYGKVGEIFFPLLNTTDDWEALEKKVTESEFIISGLNEAADNWKAEYDNCRAILKELVDLKIMKENLYKGNPDGKEYAERKPLAWEAAKKFLESYQHL